MCTKRFLLVHVGSLECREGSTGKGKRWLSLAGTRSSDHHKGNYAITGLYKTFFFLNEIVWRVITLIWVLAYWRCSFLKESKRVFL